MQAIGAVGGIFLLIWAGCADRTGWIPRPTPDMASGLGVGLRELQRGRGLYMQFCARCHPRVKPGTTEPEYWRAIVPHMAEHAQLNATEERELLIYLMGAYGTVYRADLEH